jgi:cytidine deaminase
MYHPALIARNTLSKHDSFRVGVYLETNSYGISQGNVQHPISSRHTMCAERIALMIALSNSLIPVHLHMVTDNGVMTFPCGCCREYMAAFPKLKITTYSSDGSEKITKTAKQLLPNPFKRDKV